MSKLCNSTSTQSQIKNRNTQHSPSICSTCIIVTIWHGFSIKIILFVANLKPSSMPNVKQWTTKRIRFPMGSGRKIEFFGKVRCLMALHKIRPAAAQLITVSMTRCFTLMKSLHSMPPLPARSKFTPL